MNKLKFTRDEGSAFYSELKAAVDQHFTTRQLEKTGGNKMLRKIVLYFGLDLFFYYAMITSSAMAGFYCFYLLMGLSILLTAFNISHDAAHGVAVKSKYWNKVLFAFSFNLQGNNAYVWGKNHNESHHLYTNIEGSDIDVLNNPLFRMTSTQPLKKMHRYQYLYAPVLYLFYSLNWFLFRETLLLFNYSSRTIKIDIPLTEAIKLIFFKILYIGYMIVLPVLLLPFGWPIILLAFLLNHFIVSWLFVAVLGVSHLSDYVKHPQPNAANQLNMSWPKLQMCTSVDYNAASHFCNWTLGGFNAHALHHLLPNISHVHYLDILPIFKKLAAKHGITYMEMSYTNALISHFRFLKVMGRQQDIKPKTFLKARPGRLLTLFLFMICSTAADAQTNRRIYPVGTYHQKNTIISGISAGLATMPNQLSSTNGIKIEAIGMGLLLLLAPRIPIAATPTEYDSLMHTLPQGYNNGLVVSPLGTICDCRTNGMSLGYIAQLNRTVNGLSASVAINFANKHNGVQLGGIFCFAYQTNGLQFSAQNKASISNGLQAGIYNLSENHHGVQLGILNRAKRIKGVQLGIWNENPKRKLPFINWQL